MPDKKPINNENRKEKIEKIAEEFCDKYCRFPYICASQEQLDTVCEGCPMNKLFKISMEEGVQDA